MDKIDEERLAEYAWDAMFKMLYALPVRVRQSVLETLRSFYCIDCGDVRPEGGCNCMRDD